MQASCTYVSVRGAPSNGRSYRDTWGFANKAIPGRSPALSDEQMAELLNQIVLAGPDLAKDGVVRWRCCDLQKVIVERFGVAVHEPTVGKLLRRLA